MEGFVEQDFGAPIGGCGHEDLEREHGALRGEVALTVLALEALVAKLAAVGERLRFAVG